MWIPSTVDDLLDYFGWMRGRMPDFRNPYGRSMPADEIFANAVSATRNLEQELGARRAAGLLNGLASVRKSMDEGDLLRATHLLQDMSAQIEPLSASAQPGAIN